MNIRLGFILFSTILTLQAVPASAGNVYSDDIIDGQVMNVDIGTSAVTTDKIMDGTVGPNDLANLAVTNGKIALGAVGDAQIAGPISASKISTIGLDADTIDGKHAADFAAALHTHAQSDVSGLADTLAEKSAVTHDHDPRYQQKYGMVAVVAQTGGDYMDPVTAMSDIATWCGTPSSSNPCLLKLMPGNYNIGGGSLHMKQYVDVEGSGENVTRIVGSVEAGANENSLIFGASDSEIRSLTLENSGSRVWVMKNDNASPKISNVTLVASGSQSRGMNNLNAAAPLLTNVVIDSSGYSEALGMANWLGASVEMVNTKITLDGGSCYGVIAADGSIDMKNIEVNTSSCASPDLRFAIYNDSSHPAAISLVNSKVSGKIKGPIDIANTEIDGLLFGTFRCINAYDSNFNVITCP